MTEEGRAERRVPAPSVVPMGDSAVRVEVGDSISPEVHDRVIRRLATLDAGRPTWVVDLVPGYRSVLVIFDPLRAPLQEVLGWIEGAREAPVAAAAAPRHHLVPVCYDPSVAPDLAELAALKGLSVADVIRRHSAVEYRVHMLGFRPGFPYLGGLDPTLATPRLASPRPQVPAGSVAIGGAQAGIYPVPSPGGWRLIGRTPLRLFDPGASEPFRFRPGDRVRFEPIALDRLRQTDEYGHPS